MKQVNTLLTLVEPIEHLKFLVRQVTNRVHHPDGWEAINDIEAWDTKPFTEHLLEMIFHYEENPKPKELHEYGENRNPLWRCEEDLMNAGVSVDDATLIAQAVYEVMVDTIAAMLPHMVFNNTQTHQYALIDGVDLMVMTTNFLMPGDRHDYPGAFRRENSWD